MLTAKAPQAVIGGNHVGAELLAKMVVDKFRYHLPEYRQVKQYADLGLKLPTSTINDWMHAVAAKLDPVYEAQRKEVLQGDYLQIDEVPWNIIDRPGKQRKGYAWQFLDSRPDSHGLYFLYLNGSRAGTIPRAELRNFRGAIQTDGNHPAYFGCLGDLSYHNRVSTTHYRYFIIATPHSQYLRH